MSLTRDAVFQQFELFQSSNDPERDIRPLVRAVKEHFRHGATVSDMGPCLAVIWFSVTDYEHPWYVRLWGQFFVRLVRLLSLKRPLWNDFHMCLWMLSRDQHYVCELHRHLATAIRKRRYDQASSGHWMITSVCQQDNEFKSAWNLATAQHGEIF